MTDQEIAETRKAVLEYRHLPVIEVLERIERDDRVPVLQGVCEDRRLRVREAANRRLWILSTRGPAEPAAPPPRAPKAPKQPKTPKH